MRTRLPLTPARLAGAALGLAVVLAAAGWMAWSRVPSEPPEAGKDLGGEPAAFRAAAAKFRGRIVWSSNRGGNHEIHLLDLRGAEPRLERLTSHPHVDSFPRFSPDGKEVLFNRSRRPWVSFRESAGWDVWRMAAGGGGERRVAEVAYHASWADGGRAAVFSRKSRVMRVDLDSGAETVLVDAAKAFGGDRVAEVSVEGSRVAMTVREGARAFGLFDSASGDFARFGRSGCQIAWQGPESLVWIEARGRGGNRIMAGPPDPDAGKVLVDMPGEYSHEYFPRLSPDGRWLVFGASAGGHEHDRADYEIFLWQVGRPLEEAMRITHHSGNDQWPDVLPEP